MARDTQEDWPELPLEAWQDTYATLHMWSQIVGKVRLALAPRINHWWEVPLYVSALGLTTSAIPYPEGNFEVEFDFIHHRLTIKTSQNTAATVGLRPRTVADFYQEFMAALGSLGIAVKIWKMPVEIPNPIAFDQDTQHASYDPEYANRFWRILASSEKIFTEFRARFIGKSQPGAFLLGQLRPGGDAIFRAPRSGTSRSRCRHARSIFARSEQRGFLAGRRRYQGSGILCVRGAGTGGIRASSCAPGEGLLSSADAGIFADVRRCTNGCIAARSIAGIFAEHLRSRGQSGEVESQGPRESSNVGTRKNLHKNKMPHPHMLRTGHFVF